MPSSRQATSMTRDTVRRGPGSQLVTPDPGFGARLSQVPLLVRVARAVIGKVAKDSEGAVRL